MAEPALNVVGAAAVDLDGTIFREETGAGFGSFSLGNVAPPHLAQYSLQDDLTVSGTTVDGSSLGNVDLIHISGGQLGDNQTSLIYDARTGAVSVEAPGATDLTSIRIGSSAGIFTGEPALNLGGDFDLDRDDRIFKATFGDSFGSVEFGKVAQPGLSESFVQGDVSVVGTKKTGGGLGNVDLIYLSDLVSLPLASGQFGDDQTSIIYDAGTGRVMVEAPQNRELSWLSIDSVKGVFGEPWLHDNLGGRLDALSERFVLKGPSQQGFGSLAFGKIADAGLAESTIRSDLFVRGNGRDGNGLGNVDLIYLPGTSSPVSLQSNGQFGDDQASIIYDAGTGQLSLEAPAGSKFSSVDIVSHSGIFRSGRARNVDGPFDTDTYNDLFKADFGGGFDSVDFGNFAQVGLAEGFLRDDLNVLGSLVGGGDLKTLDLIYLTSLRVGRVGDSQTSIVYDASTGRVMVDAPHDHQLTSIRLGSERAIFTGASADNLGGDFDLDRDDRIFKATFGSSFGSIGLGKVAQPGLDESLVRRDLTVDGTLVSGTSLRDVDLVYLPGSGANPGLAPGGQLGDDRTSIVYYSDTGRVLLDAAGVRNSTPSTLRRARVFLRERRQMVWVASLTWIVTTTSTRRCSAARLDRSIWAAWWKRG